MGCELDAKAGCEDQVIAECLHISEQLVVYLEGRTYCL